MKRPIFSSLTAVLLVLAMVFARAEPGRTGAPSFASAPFMPPPSLPELESRFAGRPVPVDAERFSLTLDPPAGAAELPAPVYLLLGDLKGGRYLHFTFTGKALWGYSISGEKCAPILGEPVPKGASLTTAALSLANYQSALRLYWHGRPVWSGPLKDCPWDPKDWQAKRVTAVAYCQGGPPAMRLQKLEPIRMDEGFMRKTIGIFDLWEVVSGRWKTCATGLEESVTPNPFVLVSESSPESEEESFLVTGRPYWNDFRMEVSIRREKGAQAGLLIASQKGGDGFLLTLSEGPHQERLLLEERRDGRATRLGEARLAAPAGRWFRLGVEAGEDGRIVGKVDGTPLLEYRSPVALTGEVGLFSRKGEVRFDDFRVRSLSEPEPMRPVLQQSLVYSHKPFDAENRDWLLVRWTKGSDLWTSKTLKTENGLRHGALNQTVLFGDFRVEYAPPAPCLLTLHGPGNECLRTFAADPSRGPALLERKNGRFFWQERPVKDLAPQKGVKIGFFSPSPFRPEAPKPEILSRNVWHEFFEGPPVGWHEVSGAWEIRNRWNCEKKWNFFQGYGRSPVVSFSKDRFEGDQVHEFHYSMKDVYQRKFENQRNARHDVNFSFCTNGKDLDSGYTLLFGGYDNAATYLLKGGRVLAENREIRFEPFRGNINDLHVEWFKMRVVKVGDAIQVSRDGQILFHVRDPKPLSGGHAALWTFKNGVVYGLLRSMAEARTNESRIYLEPYGEAGETAWTPLEPERVHCRALDGGLTEVVNRLGGGAFAARYALKEPVDLEQTPVLVIPFEPGPNALVNLNVKVGGRAFIVKANAPVEESYDVVGHERVYVNFWEPFAARALAVPFVAPESCYKPGDREIRVNLYAEAKKRFPDLKTFLLEDIVLGNASNKDYLLCGFHGNPSGASYRAGTPVFGK
ncbi:MAG: hypothetical protein V1918_05610 [Planctomycetota bacterium]